ncbi:unnamed protein product [Cyprideis torosa]|uniref:Uncharacterized protein n=1 Tax=Cyprideis torosa TaxID=163714 RepID=A0A7R8WMZ3_9CRUS|nr:unnamed protein product [Cyprideis torosa]CAG0900053.1 unnamed protein product [Cyprideis torosa]
MMTADIEDCDDLFDSGGDHLIASKRSSVSSLSPLSDSPTYANLEPYGQDSSSSVSYGHGQPQGQASTSSALYGQPQGQASTSFALYGQPQGQASTSSALYGQPQGQASTSSALYGQPQAQASTSSALYGQPQGRASTSSDSYGQPHGPHFAGQSSLPRGFGARGAKETPGFPAAPWTAQEYGMEPEIPTMKQIKMMSCEAIGNLLQEHLQFSVETIISLKDQGLDGIGLLALRDDTGAVKDLLPGQIMYQVKFRSFLRTLVSKAKTESMCSSPKRTGEFTPPRQSEVALQCPPLPARMQTKISSSTVLLNGSMRLVLLRTPKGKEIAADLQKNGKFMSKAQRTFFVKELGIELMETCSEKNKPTPDEIEKALDIVFTEFPSLAYPDPACKYAPFFDRKTHTGWLPAYIRGQRHHNPRIQTQVYNKVQKKSSTVESLEEKEKWMRLSRPSSKNSEKEHLEGLRSTFKDRRLWIQAKKPMVGEIIERYPRLGDLPDAITQEFQMISGLELPILPSQFSILFGAVATHAKQQGMSAVEQLLNSPKTEEGGEALALIEALISIVPTKQRKRKGNGSPAVVPPPIATTSFIKAFPHATAEEALSNANLSYPGILRAGARYFVAVDKLMIAVKGGTLVDALDVLIAVAHVFNVEYYYHAKFAMNFLEKFLKIPTVHYAKSAELAKDIFQIVNVKK